MKSGTSIAPFSTSTNLLLIGALVERPVVLLLAEGLEGVANLVEAHQVAGRVTQQVPDRLGFLLPVFPGFIDECHTIIRFAADVVILARKIPEFHPTAPCAIAAAMHAIPVSHRIAVFTLVRVAMTERVMAVPTAI